MTEYYKALRPDGTDFATGTTKPRKGRWMPRIEGDLVMCRRGYHVADAPAETLIGGSWPCKLARVKIPGGEWEREDHKLVVPTYRVVEWLPSWQALGPNGQEVATLIVRAGRLTADEVRSISAAWDAVWSAARIAARNAAWDAARSAAWSAAADAGWREARRAAADAARQAGADATWEARQAAAGAARQAAWALLVRDLITAEQFETLYGPWRKALGGQE